MAIAGFRTTGNFVTDQRPKSWREGVLLRHPNGKAPLFALTNLMKSESVTDPEFYWWEKQFDQRRYTLSANIDNAVTTIPIVGKGTELRAGDILLVEGTGEKLFVQSVASNTSITVATRGWASTPATAVTVATDNPNLLWLGAVFEEGSAAPQGRNWDPEKIYNVTQIFRDTLEMTRTARKTRLRTGDALKEAKRECYETHQLGIERALLFGSKWEGTLNGKPARTTQGILGFIPSANKTGIYASSSGNITMDDIDEIMLGIFKWGADEKLGFCGNRWLTTLQQAVRKNSSYQIYQGEKEYGMNVSRIVCPHGTLVVKTHPLYNINEGGTNFAGLNSACTILDAANLKYRHFEGDDMRYEEKLAASGVDGEKSGFITECGLELHHAQTHFHLTNWQKGEVDS